MTPTSGPSAGRTVPLLISGPDQLVQAVPYLLRFQPHVSLVLIGLRAGHLVVTARLDLEQPGLREVVLDTLRRLAHASLDSVVAVLYPDRADSSSAADAVGGPVGTDARAPAAPLRVAAGDVHAACRQTGHAVLDVLVVSAGRWRSLECADGSCCPADGRPVPDEPSEFAVAAVVDGVVALADRDSLAAQYAPWGTVQRDELRPFVADEERLATVAAAAGRWGRWQRAAVRALFAAARASDVPGWSPPAGSDVARLGVALARIPVRDAVWLAVDDGRIGGAPLWRDLGRRLPAPYGAAPLLLAGWRAWRDGDGAAASIAALRSREEFAAGRDASLAPARYSAAELLLTALESGMDPHRVPRLRSGARAAARSSVDGRVPSGRARSA